jgi:hypothetical protein
MQPQAFIHFYATVRRGYDASCLLDAQKPLQVFFYMKELDVGRVDEHVRSRWPVLTFMDAFLAMPILKRAL